MNLKKSFAGDVRKMPEIHHTNRNVWAHVKFHLQQQL